MNYFELYEIPVSFKVNDEAVKKKYFELSRKFHPDFFITQSQETQQEVLDMSTVNTRAFQTLSDFDKRMKYVLELKNMIQEGERYELSPDFLMEMMEINEALMEKNVSDLELKVSVLFSDLFEEVKSIIEDYNDATANEGDLKKIKDYYYKKKYLLRLKKSLDTFGAS